MVEAYPDDSLKRVQEIQTEILRIVSLVCDEFDLTWFADGGTCLGAVRHGGFIPWDDDVDIAMPLDDYLLFCRVAPQVLPEEYGLYTVADTPNYPPLFAKVYKKGTRFIGKEMAEAGFDEGIFIDIFAYAQLDSNEKKAARQVKQAAFWSRMSYLRNIAHPIIPKSVPCKKLVGAGLVAAHAVTRHLYTPQSIEQHLYQVFTAGDGKGKWTDIFYTLWGTFDEDELFPVVKAPFETITINLPHNADAFLTKLYGDYMQEPPESERFTKPPLILDFGDGINVVEQR